MINILDYLKTSGSQTIQGEIPYIEDETREFFDDQTRVLQFLTQSSLLSSADAICIYREITSEIACTASQVEEITNVNSKPIDLEIKDLRKDKVALAKSRLNVDLAGFVLVISILIFFCFRFSLKSSSDILSLSAFGIKVSLFGLILIFLDSIKPCLNIIKSGKEARIEIEMKRKNDTEKLKILGNEMAELLTCRSIMELYNHVNGLSNSGINAEHEKTATTDTAENKAGEENHYEYDSYWL